MSIRVKYIHFPDWAKVIEGLKNQKEKDPIIVSDEAEARTFLKTANSTINPFYYFIVFIKSTKEIYTHGEFYNCSDTGSSDIDQILEWIQGKIEVLEDSKVDSEDFSNLVSEVEENEEVTAKALTELNNVKASKVDVDELINQIKDLINLKEDRLSCDDFKTINGICPLGEGEINIVEPDHFRTNPTVQSGTIQTVSVNGDGHVTSITARSLTPTDIPDLDASKISSGTISIDRLPAGALERLYTVATESAAMSLTIQEGDVVRITGNDNKMYFCVSDSATTFASKFTEFTAGSATSVPWSGITDKPVGIDGWGDRIGVIEGTLPDYLPKTGGTVSGYITASGFTLSASGNALMGFNANGNVSKVGYEVGYGAILQNYNGGACIILKDDMTSLINVPLTVKGNLTATKFIGALQGNADSATTATNATNVYIYNSTSSGSFPLTFVSNSSEGNKGLFVSTGKSLTFNPATGNLTATTFTGNLTGASTSSYLLNAKPNPADNDHCVYYYSGQPSLGDNTGNAKEGSNDYNLWSYPANSTSVANGTANIMSLRLQWTTLYLHEIFASPNMRFLWHRNIRAGGKGDWSKIVEEDSTVKWAINISGNADSATKLATPRKIWGQSFDGTADVNGSFSSKGTYGGFALYGGIRENESVSMEILNADGSWKSLGIAMLTNGNVGIGTNTPSEKLHVNGNVKATSFIGDLTGNATSATKATQDGSGNVITDTYATKAYSTINIGSTAISSNSKTGTFTIVAGSNITLTPDATNKKVTIAATNTTYNVATTSANGLMSASDKSKLDGIAAGAQVNSITGVKGNAESNYRTGNVNITAANLGITVINNTKDADKNVKSATTASTCTGNAATATKLQTSRSIWGQSFDGSGNINGNFTTTGNITASGTLTLNGTTISYDKTKNAFVLPANLVVQGDVACTATLSSFDPNTITESVMIDGSTIKRNSNGTLYVNSSALGTIPTKLSQLTDDVVSGHYLPTSGGTINGNLVTLGTINANGITVNGTVRATSFISDIFRNMPLSEFNAASVSIDPNKYYRLTTAQSSLTITLNTPADNTILNEYFIEFPCGGSVSLPSGLIWANGKAPEFESGATYQISIVNNLAIFTKFVS